MKRKKVILISAIILFVAIAAFLVIDLIIKQRPDPLSVQCQAACEGGNIAKFCIIGIPLNDGSTATCLQLSTSAQYSSYGVKLCPTISCAGSSQKGDQTCVTGLGGTWTTPISGGCPQSGIKIVRQVYSSDQAPIAGQICCV